ncbi:MAG: IPT/TIG domain-containing protein [Candidatus Saganbacteria bacterium]|nr:IPT/TIG domain-containing protein [Candidatus Saganbacteria bacterium]
MLSKKIRSLYSKPVAVAVIAALLLLFSIPASFSDSWITIGTGVVGGTVPSVTSISPVSGLNTGTTEVTISGVYFTGTSAVKIDSFPVQSFSVVNDTTITAVIQSGIIPNVYHITVTNADGTSATSWVDQFSVISTSSPAVTSITPSSGINNAEVPVTITGTNLSGATAVNVGATGMTIVSNSSTEIIARVPSGLTPGTYYITVTNADGTSPANSSGQFTVLAVPVPAVSGVSPTFGLNTAGTPVTITGTNLATASSVKIGTDPVSTFAVISDTTINAVIQSALTPGVYHISVTNTYGTSATSSADQFTVISSLSPVVTGISPTSGNNDVPNDITITGTNLSSATAVKIGTVPLTMISNSATEIRATIPSGLPAGTYDITVVTPGGTSPSTAADRFTAIDFGPSTSVLIDNYEGVEVSAYNNYGTGCSSVFNTNPLFIKNGAQSRRILYSFSSDWGGLMKGDLVSNKNLILTNAFAFWLKGDGTNNTIRLDVFEATNVSPYGSWSMTHEIYSGPAISLKNTEWQFVKIPFKSLVQNFDNGTPTDGNGIFDKNISAYQFVYTGKNTSLTPHYVDYLIATVLNPPAAPTSFAGTATGTTGIKWTWARNSTNETGFNISDGAGALKKTVASPLTEANEAGLSANTPYTRYCAAYNDDGASATTEAVTRYTLANTPVNLHKMSATVASIKFAWDAGDGGSSKYSVYRAKDKKGTPGDWIKIKDSIKDKEYNDDGLEPDTKYWYGISAYNGDGIETDVVGKDSGSAVGILTSADTIPPVISDVTVDEKTVLESDLIATKPTIKATITDNVSVDAASITVEAISTFSPTSLPAVSFNPVSGLMTLTLTDPISAGEFTLKITAKDAPAGNSTTFTRKLKVSDGTLYIEGSAFNYPNPFNPLAETTKLGFNISKDATVIIYLFDTTGRIAVKRSFVATAGYNEFMWDGRDDYGDIASNGIYMARIVGDGKLIGRAKIWVIKK